LLFNNTFHRRINPNCIKLIALIVFVPFISSCTTPENTYVSKLPEALEELEPLKGPVFIHLSKYHSVAIIFDKTGLLDETYIDRYHKKIFEELDLGLRKIGYTNIYAYPNAKKAELWIRIRVDSINSTDKSVTLNVKFLDRKKKIKLYECDLLGTSDNPDSIFYYRKDYSFWFPGDSDSINYNSFNSDSLDSDNINYNNINSSSSHIENAVKGILYYLLTDK
jgi:hypothetical protein